MSNAKTLLAMPCPRLELRWVKDGDSWRTCTCVYSLVIPLDKLDIRSTDHPDKSRELVLEMSRTNVASGDDSPPIYDGKVDTPYRDGAHAQWDCEALGGHLPIVAVCGDVATLVEKRPRGALA